MKKLLSVLLMICLLVVPVHAEEMPGQPLENGAAGQEDQVVVKSLEELQEAIVAADAWYAPYVRVIQTAGIVNGVGGGKYDPNGTVTWAQVVTILTRFVEAQEIELQHIQYNGWATPALKTAVALGWIEDSAAFSPDAIISRGELVQLVNGVLALYR